MTGHQSNGKVLKSKHFIKGSENESPLITQYNISVRSTSKNLFRW